MNLQLNIVHTSARSQIHVLTFFIIMMELAYVNFIQQVALIQQQQVQISIYCNPQQLLQLLRHMTRGLMKLRQIMHVV